MTTNTEAPPEAKQCEVRQIKLPPYIFNLRTVAALEAAYGRDPRKHPLLKKGFSVPDGVAVMPLKVEAGVIEKAGGGEKLCAHFNNRWWAVVKFDPVPSRGTNGSKQPHEVVLSAVPLLNAPDMRSEAFLESLHARFPSDIPRLRDFTQDDIAELSGYPLTLDAGLVANASGSKSLFVSYRGHWWGTCRISSHESRKTQ